MNHLEQLEQECQEQKIPAIDPSVGQLLAILTRSLNALRVLEIGTAIGYSALWICRGLPEGGRLVTIETNRQRAEQAQANFAQAQVEDRVELMIGNAMEILPKLESGFDLIFLDATKSIYPELYQLSRPLLRPGGLLITDNVLFKGMVLTDETPPPYYRNMVNGLRRLWQQADELQDWQHGYLEMSDGLLLGIKGE